jgi:dienelactone hydrolase
MREAAHRVTFEAEGRQLVGWIYYPKGDGPFPAVLWNHGSERNPVRASELALFYAGHGYVFFVPLRHGHGESPGEYIGDQGPARQVELQELYNKDVVAALEWLKRQSRVDPDRLAVSGVSYGGIQTLLLAEKGLGVRAFIAFAPGAMSWRNPAIRARELEAVKNTKAPLFLLQASNDFSTGPSEVLGPVIRAKGGANRAVLYPAYGISREDGHGGFASRERATAIWGADVLEFLAVAGAGPNSSLPR